MSCSLCVTGNWCTIIDVVKQAAGVPGSTREDRVYNFISCTIDSVGWPVGMIFFSLTTIIPLYMRRLGAGDFAIGCVPALVNLLMFLTGTLVVRHLTGRKRARGFLIWVAMAERLALLPLAILTCFWWKTHPDWLIVTVFVCFMAYGLSAGFNQPAYWIVVAKVIPPHWRGRMFGYAGGIGGILCLVVERVLKHLLSGPGGGMPMGYTEMFIIGFVILMVSVMPLGFVREPPSQEAPADKPALFRDFQRLWRTDHEFRIYLFSQMAMFASTLAAPFYVLAAVHRLHAGPAMVAGYAAALGFSSMFGVLVLGWWSDRSGNKIVLLFAAVLAIGSPLGAMLATSPVQFYPVLVAMSLSASGLGLAGSNIVMEFAMENHHIALYSSFYNALSAIPRSLAPLIGGAIAYCTAGYVAGFALSSVLALIGLILTVRIQDPRRRVRTVKLTT
jgi:MFS family permease